MTYTIVPTETMKGDGVQANFPSYYEKCIKEFMQNLKAWYDKNNNAKNRFEHPILERNDIEKMAINDSISYGFLELLAHAGNEGIRVGNIWYRIGATTITYSRKNVYVRKYKIVCVEIMEIKEN